MYDNEEHVNPTVKVCEGTGESELWDKWSFTPHHDGDIGQDPTTSIVRGMHTM